MILNLSLKIKSFAVCLFKKTDIDFFNDPILCYNLLDIYI